MDEVFRKERLPNLSAEQRERYEKLRELERSIRRPQVALWNSRAEGAGRQPCHAFACKTRASDPKEERSCKLCKKKGSFKCQPCKGKGTSPCVYCAGAKRQDQICRQCMGTGTAVSLESSTLEVVAICPWCEDERFFECDVCAKEGRYEQVCSGCASEKELPCTRCRGTSRQACSKCSSTGEAWSQKKERYVRCEACRAKGYHTCDACTKGKVDCRTCRGGGRALLPCRHCAGHLVAACTGCLKGSGRAWLLTSEQWLEEGRPELAAAYLREGIRREELYGVQLVVEFTGKSDARYALERELKEELAERRKKLKSVEKKPKAEESPGK